MCALHGGSKTTDVNDKINWGRSQEANAYTIELYAEYIK